MITAPTAACNNKPRLPACSIYLFGKNLTKSVSLDICTWRVIYSLQQHTKKCAKLPVLFCFLILITIFVWCVSFFCFNVCWLCSFLCTFVRLFPLPHRSSCVNPRMFLQGPLLDADKVEGIAKCNWYLPFANEEDTKVRLLVASQSSPSAQHLGRYWKSKYI